MAGLCKVWLGKAGQGKAWFISWSFWTFWVSTVFLLEGVGVFPPLVPVWFPALALEFGKDK